MANKKSLLMPTVLVVLGVVELASLGFWQLDRLAGKNELIARVATRTGQTPVPVPDREKWPGLDIDMMEYRPVTVLGRYLHGREMHVFAQLTRPKGPHRGSGFWIITPLDTKSGVFLVNRGFVPRNRQKPQTRAAGQVKGIVSVTGLVRKVTKPSWFSPDNQPDKNQWYSRDIAAMSRHIGRGDTAPFLIDAVNPTPPGGLPQPGETRLKFPNSHLQYALTWFGLAGALLVIFGLFVFRQIRPARP